MFDATAQLNGPMRHAFADGQPDRDGNYSPKLPGLLRAGEPQDQANSTSTLGCENIGNYKQEHPILAADQPFSTAFNSSVVWGPLMGPQVLYRPAMELVLRVFYSADIEPCRQSLPTSL